MIRLFQNIRWRLLSTIFAFIACFISLAIYWYHPVALERLDEQARDIVFQFRAPPKPPQNIAVVAVDEKSVRQYGRWPWSRQLQANLVDSLKQYGTKVIALDIVYPFPSNPDADTKLEQVLKNPRGDVIGGYFFRDEQTYSNNANWQKLLGNNQINAITRVPGSIDPIQDYAYVEGSLDRFSLAMQGLGFFNFFPEPDGLSRYAPLVLPFQTAYFPSLPLKAVSTFNGGNFSMRLDEQGIADIQLDGDSIPVDSFGRLALNFYNSVNEDIPSFSASDIMSGKIDKQEVENKLIFVGVTEIGIADRRPTPVDADFPGVMLHATVAGNILQKNYLTRDARSIWVDVLLVCFLPFLLVWLIARFRKPYMHLLLLAGVITFVSLLFYWFVNSQAIIISLFYPLFSAFIGYIFYQLYYVLVSHKHSKFLRGAFSSYVSPNLVNRLIAEPERLSLTGEQKEITVLFSDVRGFTTLSEELGPKKLVAIINDYLGPMTDIVMEQEGTLDKYIGDALMAIYNAPLDVENHAGKAVQSSIDMFHSLDQLNIGFKQVYGVELAIGIGLHTGQAIVGNMGSAKRFDYTAMGDTVNLGARLEGQTKTYGVEIIVSDSTCELLDESFLVRQLDRIKVKGKTQAVTIYQVFLEYNETNQLVKQRFESALNDYFNDEFGKAKQSLENILVDYPNDGPSKLFIQRSEQYLQSPPDKDWGGVFVAMTK